MTSFEFPEGKKIEDIELVMFDKDGTIFDIHHYWCSMIRLRSRVFSEKFSNPVLNEELNNAMGVDESTGKLKPQGPVGIKSRRVITEVVSETLKNHEIEFSPEEVEIIFKEVDVMSKEYLDDFLVFLPGALEFIKSCHESGLTLTIATTDITPRAESALNLKNISTYFSLICGADLVPNTKPAPDMGKLTLDKLSIDPQKAIMIGDHTVDIKFAENTGLKAGIGVTTGLLGSRELSNSTEYVIDDLSKIRITK